MLAGKSLDVTPYAGYMMSGNFIDGPLGTSLSTGAAPISIPMPNGAASYTPSVQAGVGAMRLGGNLRSTGLNTTATNLAGNLGAGIDLNFGASLALRLLAKDYISKFDFKQATSFDISGRPRRTGR